MLAIEKLINKIDQNRAYIWGGVLSSTIASYAVVNVVFILLAIVFLLMVFYRKKIQFQKMFVPILLYFLWGCSSLLWTTDLENTFSGIIKGAYLVLIPLFVSQYSYFNKKDLSVLIRIVSLSLLIYFLVSIFYSGILFLNDFELNHFFYHNLTVIFENNAIYISLLTGICILLLLFKSHRSKIDYFLLGSLILYLLLLSSKNIIISTLFIGVVGCFYKMKSFELRKNIIFIISAIAGIGFMFFISTPLQERFIGEFQINFYEIWHNVDFLGYDFTGTSLRVFQWRIIVEMIENGHLGMLGLGWNNINYLLYQYFDYYNFYKGYFAINFHNQYLQTLGELGFVGILLLIFIILKAIKFGYKSNLYVFVFISLISFSFLTESLLSRQKGVIIFVVFFCILHHLGFKKTFKNRPEK